ncbi:MAG: hypothetical protein LBN18_02610, partial [Dysgonamonadaceae bacterium]|nr:hypothetical protein [Dysgonamonadaceae bacterium]
MKKNLCLFFALFASLSAFSQDSKVIESIFKTQYELSIENVAKNLEKNGFTLLSHPALAELSYSARDGSYFAMYSKNDTVDVIVILYPFSGKIGFQKSRNSAEIFYIKSSYSNTYKIHWIYNRPCGINTLVDTYDAYIHLITKGVSATKIEEIAPGLTSIYTTEGNFEVNALDGNVHISYEQARQGIENEPNPEDDYEFITNEFKIVNGRISDKEIYGAFIDWYSSLEYHFYEIANWQVSKVRFNGNKQIYAI